MRISEFIEHLAHIQVEHGDLEVVRLVTDFSGANYALVANASTPFIVKDVPHSDEFMLADVLKGPDFVVVSCQ